MITMKNGGAAFPTSDSEAAHVVAVAAMEGITDPAERDRVYIAMRAQAQKGMTLRDYFAAKALQGLIAEPVPRENEGDTTLIVVMRDTGEQFTSAPHAFAHCAYVLADAMLAERAK